MSYETGFHGDNEATFDCLYQNDGGYTLISYKCQLLQGKPHICARLLRLPWNLLSESIDKESAWCQLPNPQDKITDKPQRKVSSLPGRAASIIYCLAASTSHSKITD